MMENRTLTILAVCMCLLSVGCKQDLQPIRLATYTYATNDRVTNMTPLAQVLERRLQRKVEMTSYPDVESFIAGIKSNEVDIALINTLGYLILALDNAHMVPVANMHIAEDATDNYKTVFLARGEGVDQLSAITHSADTLTMMFVSEGSTSGNLVPRLFLSAIGIPTPETQFEAVKYGGNHTSTFEKLINGETDLCAIGSNEYYEQLQTDTTLVSQLNVLWISDEIPLGPVLINKALPPEDREMITELLLNLHSGHAEAFESIKAGWSEASPSDRFQLISDEYYNSFREVNGSKTQLEDILKMF
jgi:phosphate/phosphite/phosphonate ABC transporter binding protein